MVQSFTRRIGPLWGGLCTTSSGSFCWTLAGAESLVGWIDSHQRAKEPLAGDLIHSWLMISSGMKIYPTYILGIIVIVLQERESPKKPTRMMVGMIEGLISHSSGEVQTKDLGENRLNQLKWDWEILIQGSVKTVGSMVKDTGSPVFVDPPWTIPN